MHPVQKLLHDSGYASGDWLSSGSADATRLRTGLAFVATALAYAAALFGHYTLGVVTMLFGAAVLFRQLDAAKLPPLRLEDAGIRRGESLIPWADVCEYQRVATLNQAFVEVTFIDAHGHVQTERSPAVTARYRRLLEDSEAEAEAASEAPNVFAEPEGYRVAPRVIATSRPGLPTRHFKR